MRTGIRESGNISYTIVLHRISYAGWRQKGRGAALSRSLLYSPFLLCGRIVEPQKLCTYIFITVSRRMTRTGLVTLFPLVPKLLAPMGPTLNFAQISEFLLTRLFCRGHRNHRFVGWPRRVVLRASTTKSLVLDHQSWIRQWRQQ